MLEKYIATHFDFINCKIICRKARGKPITVHSIHVSLILLLLPSHNRPKIVRIFEMGTWIQRVLTVLKISFLFWKDF